MGSPRGLSLVIDLGWYQSEEGQSALAHLRDPLIGTSTKFFGFLERPAVPPSFVQDSYKLAFVGKSGVGKTSLINLLVNGGNQTVISPGETPGVRVTTVYWPAKIRNQIHLFHLDLWDCGESATKKYNHILPVCKQNASAIVYVFSFTDKSTFEDIDAQLSRRSGSASCSIVVGTKYGLQSDCQVSQTDVARLESVHKLSVLRVRYHQGGLRGPNNLGETAFVLNFFCDRLFNFRDQQT